MNSKLQAPGARELVRGPVRHGAAGSSGPASLVAAAMRAPIGDTALQAAIDRAWWRGSPNLYSVAEGQLREPILLMPLDELQKVVSSVLGRDVEPYEFGRPEQLLNEIKKLFPAR